MQLSVRPGAACAHSRAAGEVGSSLPRPQQRGAQHRAAGCSGGARCGRRALVTVASTPEGQSGISSNSSMLGPKLNYGGGSPSLGPPLPGGGATAKPQRNMDEVPLDSKLGLDYSKLRDLLKEGKWQEAEDEQRAKLIEAAGPLAQQRGWVYFSEVKFIPVEDMLTMDALWSAASGGRFGYKVQREIWVQKGRQWPKFFKAIDWVVGENNIYRKWPQEFNYSLEAPKGHLPLTNALRGTRLFEEVMEHEAFATKPGAAGSSGSGGSASPAWLK